MKNLAENPALALKEIGVRLPLKLSEHEVGEILDGTGKRVLTADPDGTLPDAAADALAIFVVLTVNAALAFRAYELPAETAGDAGTEEAH